MAEKEKKPRHKAITFILRNINPRQLEERYGIMLESNIENTNQPRYTTSIDGLSINSNESKCFSYLDEAKRIHRCCCPQLDINGNMLQQKTVINCFWCRNQFSSMPIGVPIKYVFSQSVKTYYSEITKDTYSIRENISTEKRKNLENDDNFKIIKKEHYIIDGCFCSFNCAYAFILDNQYKPEYNLSLSLLVKMYQDLFKQEFDIMPAPHWRLLIQYGGNLTIDEFRDQFNKVEYKDIGERFTHIPEVQNSNKVYEQKIKF